MESPTIYSPPVMERAHKLTMEVYRLTQPFLEDDPDSLAVELRRAALTVTGKLAAHHSGLPPEITQFRDAAMDAALEMDSFLVDAVDAGHISRKDTERLRQEYQEIARSLLPRANDRRKRAKGSPSGPGAGDRGSTAWAFPVRSD